MHVIPPDAVARLLSNSRDYTLRLKLSVSVENHHVNSRVKPCAYVQNPSLDYE